MNPVVDFRIENGNTFFVCFIIRFREVRLENSLPDEFLIFKFFDFHSDYDIWVAIQAPRKQEFSLRENLPAIKAKME